MEGIGVRETIGYFLVVSGFIVLVIPGIFGFAISITDLLMGVGLIWVFQWLLHNSFVIAISIFLISSGIWLSLPGFLCVCVYVVAQLHTRVSLLASAAARLVKVFEALSENSPVGTCRQLAK